MSILRVGVKMSVNRMMGFSITSDIDSISLKSLSAPLNYFLMDASIPNLKFLILSLFEVSF